MIWRLRRRFWLARHMRHTYLDISGDVWICSCCSIFIAHPHGKAL